MVKNFNKSRPAFRREYRDGTRARCTIRPPRPQICEALQSIAPAGHLAASDQVRGRAERGRRHPPASAVKVVQHSTSPRLADPVRGRGAGGVGKDAGIEARARAAVAVGATPAASPRRSRRKIAVEEPAASRPTFGASEQRFQFGLGEPDGAFEQRLVKVASGSSPACGLQVARVPKSCGCRCPAPPPATAPPPAPSDSAPASPRASAVLPCVSSDVEERDVVNSYRGARVAIRQDRQETAPPGLPPCRQRPSLGFVPGTGAPRRADAVMRRR